MQLSTEQQKSWIKLSVISSYIIGFGILSVIRSSEDIKMNMDDDNMILLLKILQAVGVLFVFILPAVLFSTLWTKDKIHYLGITRLPMLSTLLLGALGMLLALPVINYLAEINSHLKLPEALSGIESWMKNSEAKADELTKAFTKGTSISTLIINLVVIAFLAALSEELFFRGVLQKVLIECFGNKHIAIWTGAALFSAFHMQFYGFLPRMVMGAYLGYLFYWSGSLYVNIFAHFTNNALAVVLEWLANRGVVQMDADKIGTENNQWLFAFISVVLVSFCLISIYRLESKRRDMTFAEET